MDKRVSTVIKDKKLIKAAQRVCSHDYGKIVLLIKHDVVPDIWAAVTDEDWGYLIKGDLASGNAEAIEAPDTFTDEDACFFSATIREDGTWIYDPDPDPNIGEDESPVWHCYNEYDKETGAYKPSKFAPGSVVYPILFEPNVPGGWQVVSPDGKTEEYWQCE